MKTIPETMKGWLDTIAERLDYKDRYCGYWHINKRIDKMHLFVLSCVLTVGGFFDLFDILEFIK